MQKNTTTPRNGYSPTSLIVRFSRLFIPVAITITLAVFYLDQTQANSKQQSLMDQEYLRITQQVGFIHRTFDAIFSDLIILSKHNDFHHIPDAMPDVLDHHLRELATEFRQFHIYKPHYDQIRFIDNTGMEAIRTNHINGEVNIVPKGKLQNKADRSYFKRAIALKPNEVYISALELNIEHGEIQQPANPTIRFALPLFDANQQRFGILTLNYRAEFLLEQLRHSADLHHISRPMLLNVDGYWMQSDDPEKNWRFMYQGHSKSTFQQHYPQLWRMMAANASGQAVHHDGLFTFTRVHPLDSIKNRLNNNISSQLLYRAVPDDYTWILVSHIPTEKLAAIIRPATTTYIVATLLLLSLWAFIALSLSRAQHARALEHMLLEEKEAEIRNIVDSAFNGIITINEHGVIKSFNPAACRMFGYHQHETIGQNISMIVSSPHDTAHDGYLQHYIQSRQAHIIGKPREVLARRKDGTLLPVELFVTASQVEGRWLFVGILHDISERKAMQDKLTALATTDGLTGVYNRAYFNDTLSAEFKRAKRYTGRQLSLIILDADHFKSVNDQYGHPAGDALLIALAQQTQACARDTDIVARYGGEEFAIILPETDGSSAFTLAERLRQQIESMHITYDGHCISRTVSIGIACLHSTAIDNEDALLVLADQALYQAKQTGRNCVILNQPESE